MVATRNCDSLIEGIRELVDGYMDMMSFADKKQLLYIARTIELNQQNLSASKRYGYNACIADILRRCKER